MEILGGGGQRGSRCNQIVLEPRCGQCQIANGISERGHLEVGFAEGEGNGVAYILGKAVSGVRRSQGEGAQSLKRIETFGPLQVMVDPRGR